MERYEYKSVSFGKKGFFKNQLNLDEGLNKLGAEGWKIVSTISPVSPSADTTFVLIRPINE